MTPSPAIVPQDREARAWHTTTLTEAKLAAIHQLLQADPGLHAAAGASEMLVTYPSQCRAHEARKGALTPLEFENDGDERD